MYYEHETKQVVGFLFIMMDYVPMAGTAAEQEIPYQIPTSYLNSTHTSLL